MNPQTLSNDQCARFQKDGYLVVEDLFDKEEVNLLRKIAEADESLRRDMRTRHDLQGGITRLTLIEDLGDDIFGAFIRCHRTVDSMAQLLGAEVYHFNHKMMFKEPFVGGAWEWHQDYGYWYNNGLLFPDMASCMIAVDPANKQNGCLQLIKGSHRVGRIEHGKVADQTGADLERVNVILERLPLVYCEMESGSALFFHSNLLHRSDQNRSPHPRWALICVYNTAHNTPYKELHRSYKYLEKWPDSKIKEIGQRQWEMMQANLPGRR